MTYKVGTILGWFWPFIIEVSALMDKGTILNNWAWNGSPMASIPPSRIVDAKIRIGRVDAKTLSVSGAFNDLLMASPVGSKWRIPARGCLRIRSTAKIFFRIYMVQRYSIRHMSVNPF